MTKNRSRLKVLLAVLWCLITTSIVIWWWIWVLKTATTSESHVRMIQLEGATLVSILLIGGAVLVYYIWRDEQRHKNVRHFFSLFTHDLKTSISRLRLQAEILEEEFKDQKNEYFGRWLKDLNRLDLQLENSLMFAQNSDSQIFIQNVRLSQLLASIKNEFPELSLEVEQDAEIKTDKNVFISLIRNTFHNSIQHGQASKIKISIKNLDTQNIEIKICDNGIGYKGDISDLGRPLYSMESKDSHGLGLHLCVILCKKISAQIEFQSSMDKGFCTIIHIPGRLL